jgi:hypothetical protein
MPLLLLGLAVLAAIAFGIFWFLRANPSSMARVVRLALAIVGTVGVGGILIFGLRFMPGMLPELLGLAGVAVATLIARAVRRAPRGGFSTPGAAKRTVVRTAYLDAWIDHGTGDVGGVVLKGRFTGRALDGLSDSDLFHLHGECASDGDSLRVLESYLDRRLGGAWRTMHAPRERGDDMTREDALAVLGLTAGADDEEIRAAHRRLIQRVHPDVGGSADLAARINRAKEVLLDRSKR